MFEFPLVLNISIPLEKISEARKWLNMQWLGREEANRFNPDTNEFESDYPEEIANDFEMAHRRLNAHHAVTVQVYVDKNGRVSINY